MSKLIGIQYIMSYCGKPYLWGGDDPQGFDCSGLAVEYLAAIGAIASGADFTAQGLYNLLLSASGPRRGSLAFFGKTEREIRHVAVCLSETLCLEAAGGGSHVKTAADAMKHNAFIKVRPIMRDGPIWYRAPIMKGEQ